MRSASCAACEKSVPMREAFSVAERTLCLECANKFFKERGQTKVKPGEVTRLVDPTVCAQCAKDCGDEELPRIANLPVCKECDHLFRHRPFPTWLKVSFAAFLSVAVAAFVYNLRFFLAYVDIVHANHELKGGKVEQGVAHYAAAAERIPEIPELAVFPNLFRAEKLSSEDKYDEAMALIQKSRPHAPPDMRRMFDEAELHVQLGRAFDRKDYDAFLNIAQQMNNLAPDKFNTLGALASAYACKYAVTGDAQFRDQANQYLQRAKAGTGADAEVVKDFEDRIQYRLQKREILSRKEFKERFPNGWKPEGPK
jgi:tetratricopeptide (TPR) repeat protein